MNAYICVTDQTAYMSDHCLIYDECIHMCYWSNCLHHGVCQIIVSDLKMNVHTYVTDNTTYTMLYVRSLCQI